MKVWSYIESSTTRKKRRKQENVTFLHCWENSVTEVMFLPGIGGHLKISHIDPWVCFGNQCTNLSVRKSFFKIIAPYYIYTITIQYTYRLRCDLCFRRHFFTNFCAILFQISFVTGLSVGSHWPGHSLPYEVSTWLICHLQQTELLNFCETYISMMHKENWVSLVHSL